MKLTEQDQYTILDGDHETLKLVETSWGAEYLVTVVDPMGLHWQFVWESASGGPEDDVEEVDAYRVTPVTRHVTTYEKVNMETILFFPIWQRADREERVPLLFVD